MTCQPNWLWTGVWVICPSFMAKAALANSGTMSVFLNQPRSPPFTLPGSVEYLLRQLGEVRAAVELLDDRLGLGLGRHQDMAGVDSPRPPSAFA